MLFGVVLSPAPSSPMWWMGVAYGGYLGILVVEIWSMFAHRPRLHQAVCTMAAVMAIVAPSTLGAVFGALPNRPFWHGPVSSLWMLGSALLTGASLLGVVVATVARLDEMALFYLKSRGVGAENARALLTYAFAAEVLETVEVDALREGLEAIAFRRFTHQDQR